MSNKETEKSKLEKWLQIGSLIIAIITVVITVFFSVRSEKTKEITVTYLSKRPLVTIDGNHASAGLEVRLNSNPVSKPWLISGRLENTGNLPIEERDIEAPLRLSFKQGVIVGAEVVEKSQAAIFAKATFKEKDVAIAHKLLNSGDWIAFDLIFDGEPNLPPALSFRISGVSEPKQRVVTPGEKLVFLTALPLSTTMLYLVLSLGTLGGIAITIVGIGLFVSTVKQYLKEKTETNPLDEFEKTVSKPDYPPALEVYGRVERVVVSLINKFDTRFLLDLSVSELALIIEREVPLPVLAKFGIDAEKAAKMVSEALKASLKSELTSQLYILSSYSSIDEVRAEVDKLDATQMSARELINRAKEVASKVVLFRKKHIDTEALWFGFVAFVMGASMLTVLGGTWRTVLSI